MVNTAHVGRNPKRHFVQSLKVINCARVLHVMDAGRFSSLRTCASKRREWTVTYQARLSSDWLIKYTSNINCAIMKSFFGKFNEGRKEVKWELGFSFFGLGKWDLLIDIGILDC